MSRSLALAFCLTSVAAASSIGGCDSSPPPEFPLTEVCANAEYGTQVITEGYLAPPGAMMSCDGETCGIALVDSSRSISVRIDVRLGRGKNSMDEPLDRWNNGDIVVRDD